MKVPVTNCRTDLYPHGSMTYTLTFPGCGGSRTRILADGDDKAELWAIGVPLHRPLLRCSSTLWRLPR